MRYACYCISVLLLFVLIAFINQALSQINRQIDTAAYLFLAANRPEIQMSNAAATSRIYSEAPPHLQALPEFLEIKRRHQRLLNVIDSGSEQPSRSAQAAAPALKALVNDLAQLHQLQLNQVKLTLTSMIIGGAALTIAALSLLVFPMFARHSRSLNYINKSNYKLHRQAVELRALHSTIANMLDDILYQKKQSSRTSQINARLAAIINSADDAIISLNLAGYITTANLAAVKLFGFQSEGKHFTDLFPSDTAAQLKSSLMVAEEQNSGSTMDLTMQKKQRRLDLSLTISPIRSDDQRISGFSVIAKDVSNSKLEEERFRLAVEAAPNAMIMVNAQGFIVLVNSEAERMFEYPRDELHGQPLQLLLPGQLQVDSAKYMQRFVPAPQRRQTSVQRRDLYGQRKSTEKFPIEVGLTPIEIDDETYVISSIVDISERLAQQKSLTDLNQELSRKNQEMEQFIYTVSHDLKAPLVTIAGFTNRLLQAKGEPLPAAHQHKLQRILANVSSMEALLQDLLHLSRVIKRDLDKSYVDPEATLTQVLNSLDGSIHETRAEIRLHKPFKPVYAQESLLFQCLQNVVSNAIKYAREGATPKIDIEPASAPGFSGIVVRDKGIGIAAKHHQRVFSVFERLHPEAGEGTGVGLSIVKTIVDKHGGRIELDSAEGEGTAFTLLFPDQRSHQEG